MIEKKLTVSSAELDQTMKNISETKMLFTLFGSNSQTTKLLGII